MSNQIFNTASLTFEFGSQTGLAFSNTATANLLENLSISAKTLGSNYFLKSTVTYIISVKNNSNAETKNIKISDNLASYFSDKNKFFTPLSYNCPSYLYINGTFISEPETEITDHDIMFKISSIPANSNLTLIYSSVVNQYAPLSQSSTLTNVISLTSDSSETPLTCQTILKPSEKADVRIIKNMYPNNIALGEEITYDFFLYNYGNADASNITLTDTFSPAPTINSITVNSQEINFSDYSYSNGILTIPAYNPTLNLKIPAAKFIQNSETGIITADPGITKVTVKGRI